MSVNINREVTDDFYRYKMPKLLAKVEGKGNGIKTVIVNMHEVGKSLFRPAIYPTKYFGAELGAQIQFDAKNERYIVNGAHDADKLQTILDGFIRKYVLCGNCDNPETDLLVRSKNKQGELSSKCKACGHVTPIDYNRTTQYIIKNPPDESGLNLSTSGGTSKGGKGRGRKKAGDRSPEGGSDDNEDCRNDSKPEEAGDNEPVEEVDEDDWGDEDDAEAVEDLPESIQRLIVTDVHDMTPQDRANSFHSFVEEKRKKNSLKPTELLREAERLDIRDKAIVVVVEVLLTNPSTLAADITRNFTAVLSIFTKKEPKSQKYLLGAVEHLIQRFKGALLEGNKISNLLHAFYSADILSEEALLEWSRKGPTKRHTGDKKLSKQIHELAKPFIDWLETADEESSSEEEEAPVRANKQQEKPVQNGKAPTQADEGSDVDIDDI